MHRYVLPAQAAGFNDERFHGGPDDATFANSAAALARTPFPIGSERFAYSSRVSPHPSGPTNGPLGLGFDLDEHYLAEAHERERVLEHDPGRVALSPTLEHAAVDTLELVLGTLAQDYPHWCRFERDGARRVWSNGPLVQTAAWRAGEERELPGGPLLYAARQLQGDLCLLDQRDEDLYLDGGVVTSAADWSLAAARGMDFRAWHAPVPLEPDEPVFDRALRYLLKLRADRPIRRFNWSLTVHARLDAGSESREEKARDIADLTPATAAERLHLRTELQTLWRLAPSGAILFSIRTYLVSLEDLARVPGRIGALRNAMRSMPDDVRRYKGIDALLPAIEPWLEVHA